MRPMELSNLIDRLQSQKVPRIGVLGDVILDKYLWGRVDRISPEAPVPVLVLDRKSVV